MMTRRSFMESAASFLFLTVRAGPLGARPVSPAAPAPPPPRLPPSSAVQPLPPPALPPSGRLTKDEWGVLRQLFDVILPATDRAPSASAVGALEYLDGSLAGEYSALIEPYREMIRWISTEVQRKGMPAFPSLGAKEATEIARSLERSRPELFSMVREHALEGYFAAPRHGGNRGCGGWKAVKLVSHVLPWPEVHSP